MAVLALGVFFWGSAADAQPQVFSDDFESGTLLVSDAPPGRWSEAQAAAPNTVAASQAAAHSGEWGFRLSDAQVIAGAGGEGQLRWDGTPGGPDLHLRFWIRITPANRAGKIHFVQLYAPGFLPFAEVTTTVDGPLFLSGNNDANAYLSEQVPGSALTDGWHLVELSTTGLGTAAGARRLWLDGHEVLGQEGIDWRTMSLAHLTLGAPYSDDRMFAGTLDFDDVRLSTAPHASRVALSVPESKVNARECIPAQVRLTDSASGAARPAPADMEVRLSVSEGTGWFSLDSTCVVTSESVLLPAGISEATVHFWPSAPGRMTLEAQQTDLLPAQLELEVADFRERALTSGCDASKASLSGALTVGAWFWLCAQGLIRGRQRRRWRPECS